MSTYPTEWPHKVGQMGWYRGSVTFMEALVP